MTTVTTTSTAISAGGFASSLGVNTHLAVANEPLYDNPTTVINALNYLGISYVRDAMLSGAPEQAAYNALANAGVHFDFYIWDTIPISQYVGEIGSFASAHPGRLASAEGPNEIVGPPTYNYNGDGSVTNVGHNFTPAFYSAIKANAATANTPVLDASLAVQTQTAANATAFGNQTAYADASNSHAYVSSNVSPYGSIANFINYAHSMVNKPVQITEAGYNNTVTEAMSGVDQATQAKLTLDTLFDAAAQGVQRTYLYELFNEGSDNSNPQATFGLFNWDGSAKPVATAIHNMTTILHDPGASPAAPLGSLTYTLTNAPANTHSMVIEKSDGHMDLVVWAEPQMWNNVSHTPVATAATSVSIGLGATFAQAQVFDPLASATAQATYANTSSLSVNLSDHPLIIELSPAGAGAPTPPTNPTPPTTTPAVPGVPDMQPASDSGASNTDNITNVTHPTFTGTATAGDTITLYDGANAAGTATADISGHYSVSSTTTLSNGAHTLTAVASNNGVASAHSGSLTITVDTAAPAAPSTPATTTPTSNTTPTFTGTAEAGSTIKLLDGSTQVGAGVTDGSGHWSVTALTLAVGNHTMTATATDVAGNVSAASGAEALTIQSGNPAPPSGGQMFQATGGQNLTGTSGADTLVGSQAGGDVLTGGGGNDHFAFNVVPWSAEQVTDFTHGADKIDASGLLSSVGYTGSDPVADGYIKFFDGGNGSTWLYFDSDGRGSAVPWGSYVAKLNGAASGYSSADVAGVTVSPPAPPPASPPPPPPSSGGQIIQASGAQAVTGGSGDDTLIASQAGNDTLTAGAGADHFKFNVIPWRAETITDFTAGTDKIDVHGWLQSVGYSGSNALADQYIKLYSDGANGTWVYLDSDGAGSGNPWGAYAAHVVGVAPGAIHNTDFIF